MGREVKRVDLHNPPKLGQIWHGYQNPFYDHVKACSQCKNGYSKQAAHYKNQWYGTSHFDPTEYGAKPLTMDDPAFCKAIEQKIERSVELAKQDGTFEYFTAGGRRSFAKAVLLEKQRMFEIIRGQWSHHLLQVDVDPLVEAGRLHDLTSEWVPNVGWVRREGAVVTAEMVNAWSLSGMGHDSINQWICVRARCERNGEPTTCNVCEGSGEFWPSKEMKAQAEAWESFSPPEGDGYQIWETVSEGSPVSPAFATPEELALWMVENDKSVTKGTTFDQWMKFIDAGWAPSMMTTPTNGVQIGVQAIAGLPVDVSSTGESNGQ